MPELENLVLFLSTELSGRTVGHDCVELVAGLGVWFQVPVQHADALIPDQTPVFGLCRVVAEADFGVVYADEMGAGGISVARSVCINLWTQADLGWGSQADIGRGLVAHFGTGHWGRRIVMVGIDDGMVEAGKLDVEVEDGVPVARIVGIVGIVGRRVGVRMQLRGVSQVGAFETLDLPKDHLIQPLVVGNVAHLMFLQQVMEPLQLGGAADMLVVGRRLTVRLATARLLGDRGSGGVGKGIGRFVSPQPALLAALLQGAVAVEEGYGGTAKGNVVASSAVGADGRHIPDGDGQLGVEGQQRVVDGQAEPLVPDAGCLEVLVGGLGVDGEGFAVCVDLGRDVQFRGRAQVGATMA